MGALDPQIKEFAGIQVTVGVYMWMCFRGFVLLKYLAFSLDDVCVQVLQAVRPC